MTIQQILSVCDFSKMDDCFHNGTIIPSGSKSDLYAFIQIDPTTILDSSGNIDKQFRNSPGYSALVSQALCNSLMGRIFPVVALGSVFQIDGVDHVAVIVPSKRGRKLIAVSLVEITLPGQRLVWPYRVLLPSNAVPLN